MKRKSIIASVLVMTMMLAGVGYAYWADTLNVTTKATTGDFDVTFADLGLYAQYDNEYNKGNWGIIDGIDTGYVGADFFGRGSDYNSIASQAALDAYADRIAGYSNIEFDAKLVGATPIKVTFPDGSYNPKNANGSDSILIEISGMYPGYAQAFRSDIINQGSIAAKLSQIDFTVDTSNAVTADMLGVALLIDREYHQGEEHGVAQFKLSAALGTQDFFTLGGVEFVRLSSLKDLSFEALDALLLTLPSSNRLDMYLGVAMDPDAEGVYTSGTAALMSGEDDSLSQNQCATVSIDLLWDQFNTGVDVSGTTNRLELQNQ